MDVTDRTREGEGTAQGEACPPGRCGVCPVCPSTYVVPAVLLALLVGTVLGAGEGEMGTWLIGGAAVGLALWIGIGLYRALRMR